ncbi:MAG: DUF3109 family protein [Kofleriaceae bacterium]|nr:DUF3109 family protein [Kofleriaceae bacterium]
MRYELDATVPLDHPTFTRAEIGVFTRRVVADCMTHNCVQLDGNKFRFDACCQYGSDVDLMERDAILARAESIRPILSEKARDLPWFDESAPEQDPDYPSGTVVRTAVLDGGCLFLSHDKRGCAIHRAALEQGWDFRGVKPAICRLFPVTYGEGAIFVADDYVDYSCAFQDDAPTLYRVAREALADIFGEDLVRAMDAAEAKILAEQPVRLKVV